MSSTTLEQPREKRVYRSIREDQTSHHEKTPGGWMPQALPVMPASRRLPTLDELDGEGE